MKNRKRKIDENRDEAISDGMASQSDAEGYPNCVDILKYPNSLSLKAKEKENLRDMCASLMPEKSVFYDSFI